MDGVNNKRRKKRTMKKEALRKQRRHADIKTHDVPDTTEERQQQRFTFKRSQHTQQQQQHEQRQPIQSRKQQQLDDRKNASGERKRQRRHSGDDGCSGNIAGGRKPASHVGMNQIVISINQPGSIREPIDNGNYGTPISNSMTSPIQQFDRMTRPNRQGFFIRGAAAAAAATIAHTPEPRRVTFDNQPFSFRPRQYDQLNHLHHHQQPQHRLVTLNQEEPTTILHGIPEKKMSFGGNQKQLPANTQQQFERMEYHHLANVDHEGPTTILHGIPEKKTISFANHRQHPHPHHQVDNSSSKSTPIHHHHHHHHHQQQQHQHQRILRRLGDSGDLAATAPTKPRGEASHKRQKVSKDNGDTPSKLTISNLPPGVTASTIKSLGSKDLKFVSLNQKTNSATVRFKTKAHAVNFRRKRNRAMISGRRISVDFSNN